VVRPVTTPAASLDVAALTGWVSGFFDEFLTWSDRLSDLDREAGDGDFGSNLKSPLERASHTLQDSPPATAGEVFAAVTAALWRTGGTSGPLLAAWFQQWGDALGDRTEVGLADLAGALARANAAVIRMGGADRGDRTMLDAMIPAGQALVEALELGLSLHDALQSAASRARGGAAETAEMVARRGRSSYLGTRALGVLDPGAVALAMFFAAAPGTAVDSLLL
jgi:dihydroxyacetone kinase-like protein